MADAQQDRREQYVWEIRETLEKILVYERFNDLRPEAEREWAEVEIKMALGHYAEGFDLAREILRAYRIETLDRDGERVHDLVEQLKHRVLSADQRDKAFAELENLRALRDRVPSEAPTEREEWEVEVRLIGKLRYGLTALFKDVMAIKGTFFNREVSWQEIELRHNGPRAGETEEQYEARKADRKARYEGNRKAKRDENYARSKGSGAGTKISSGTTGGKKKR